MNQSAWDEYDRVRTSRQPNPAVSPPGYSAASNLERSRIGGAELTERGVTERQSGGALGV
ncbi:MAG: hypothetical protein SynsKO_35280 [Synoicihabitans sp.]